MRWLLFVALLLVCVPAASAAQIPRAAYGYQRALVANVRVVWGLNGPIATMAAQVHQESGWNPNAKSIYAGGLAQFTPDTADWISKKYADALGTNQPYEPAWALRALAQYDKYLYDIMPFAATDCDRWAFTLSAYNGGAGWVTRDRTLATQNGVDSRRWWNNVELYSKRSVAATKENRGYPRRILLTIQPLYTSWGPSIQCLL
jgi:soluble lytic murein transglycosylase-like protein